MNFKEIILGHDPIDQKIEKISHLFDSDEFIPNVFFDEDFLSTYIPFSIFVLNTVEDSTNLSSTTTTNRRYEIRAFILTSLNKFTFKTVQNEDFVHALHKVLEEDNFHNVILTLKIFASLIKAPVMGPPLIERHISVVVDLINSVFLKLDAFDEGGVETTFFTLGQIFGYVSDVIQRQPQTEKKIEGIVHRTVSFFRLFLEHRRVVELTKYNKSFALEMISTLSKLFKIFSDSPMFNTRNDALNSTIFELSKFSLFYCPTDAINLRKELFYYIFKILLKNKEMYLPKIEEFFDIRFFYLDESFLINIKGLIGLTDLAAVFSSHLSRRVPHELQRRTSEILESNLMMVHEKMVHDKEIYLHNEVNLIEEEVKLKYEKSLKFHLEIVYECVNLIYKQMAIVEKFVLQKTDLIDFAYKQFLLVAQVIDSLKNSCSSRDSNLNKDNESNKECSNKDNGSNTYHKINTLSNTLDSNLLLVKSTFLSLSKPLKEIADTLASLLKNNVEVAFPSVDLFSAFKGALKILELLDFEEKDAPFVTEIILFFFTPFGGSVHLDIITGLISQMFAAPFFMKVYLSILKRAPTLQMVVTEIVYQLISMLTQEKSKTHNFKKTPYSPRNHTYPEMVDLYEPVFDFIADIYNYNPAFISKKTMYALVNFLSRMIASQDIEDHKLLLFLLGTFNVKNDKSGSLHVYFYKKLHVFVRDFFTYYMLTLDPLYLDIIFSFPININAITSEWVFLLNPIRCALRLRDDISVKAISAFIHIIEASKGEIVTGGNKWQIEDLFREIYDLLDDQRFTISCSQLLGRLKSYHKNYLTGTFYFQDQLIMKEIVFDGKGIESIDILTNTNKVLLNGVVLKAIEFLRGRVVVDETRTIFDINDILTFKKTLPGVNKSVEGEEAAFMIIQEFLIKEMHEIQEAIYKDEVYAHNNENYKKDENYEMHEKEVEHKKKEPFYYSSNYHPNHPNYITIHSFQMIYDAIIALFRCSETFHEKIHFFLKEIYVVAPLILPVSRNVFLRALLEAFGESRPDLACELFYILLSRIPSEDLLGVLKDVISYFLTIRNGRMSLAAFRGLNFIFQWEKLPSEIIQEDLRRMLDGLAFHMGCMKNFTNNSIGIHNLNILSGISALVKKANNLNWVCSVFKWAIDRISFGKPGDKAEMIFCEETLKMLFLKYENLFSNIFLEKIRGFFYTSNDLRDVDVFYTKVALFIYFVKNTSLFSEKETVVLAKTYFYYMLSCNFLIFSASQETFLTNLSIRSSEKYQEWERDLLKRGDLIRFLFYELPKDNSEFYDMFDHSLNLPLDVNEDERHYYYLSNEIIYMHLAFIKEKEIALVPFDIAFHNLPFGLSAPLKMLLMVNRPLIHDLLLEKYEECFNSTLSVQVVEKMITIFSIIEMKEDEKLYNFILKVFEECRTPVEGLLLAENPEISILAKTFELSLGYPDQTHLHRSVLRVAYPWLHEASRNYTSGIFKALLEYVERHSAICFPLLVREVVDEAMFCLVEEVFKKSISFKNYVNNLNPHLMNFSYDSFSISSMVFFLKFLRLVEFEVTPSQIKAAIRAYGECKLQSKPTKDIKDFLKFSINKFTENDLTLLFKTDPLLKLGGVCNVKMFKSLSSKNLFGCLLKSVSRTDIKAFENLIRFYGEQSWMLVEMFVDVHFYSPRMVEYCKASLGNGNIRSYLLYYLCTFEPLPEYFEALLGLSYEERKYTLYSLRKVVEKYCYNNSGNDNSTSNLPISNTANNPFESIILFYIKSEIHYKTNIHILYPLLAYTPHLITKDIARVLCGVVYRLLNTFIQFHQKIGTLLFDSLYAFYGPSPILSNLYNLLVLNYLNSKKSDMIQYIFKYDLILVPDFVTSHGGEALESSHVAVYMEYVIGKYATKDSIQDEPKKVIQFLFDIIKKEWFKYPFSEGTVTYLYSKIIPGDFVLLKDMHKTTLLNILRVSKEKNTINWKQNLPVIKNVVQEGGPIYASIFQVMCEYSIYLLPTTNYFIDIICSSREIANTTNINSFSNTILNLLIDIKTPVPFKIALFSLLNQKYKLIFKEEDFFNLVLGFFLKYRLAQPGTLSSLNELLYKGCTHPIPGIRAKYIQFLDEMLPGDPQRRLVSLLEFDWNGCSKTHIPYIFSSLLLGCYDSCSFNYDLLSPNLDVFLYISPESSLPLLYEIVSSLNNYNSLNNYDGLNNYTTISSFNSNNSLLFKLVLEMSSYVNDSLTYVLLKALGCPEKVDYSKIKAGHLSFYQIINETKCNLPMYRETGIKDYIYGSLRAIAKFPEVMQATVFQQFGKFKEAQKIYEDLQSECINSKVSFYEDEYEQICREWVECAKEMQQWDVLYSLGNQVRNRNSNSQTLLSKATNVSSTFISFFNPSFLFNLAADSLFYLSNFNMQNERDAFQGIVGFMEKGIKKAFYELFYSIYQVPSSENFVDLIVQIIRKMALSPRTKEFNFYYSNLIQIILEMHDTTSLFTFGADTEERINGLSYAWEDREPLIEGPYEVLLMFSTWRRHFFRRIEGYLNEGSLLNADETEEDPRKINIGTIVNKNKEYSETISKLRKTMYIKGNNELGRNANFLALAAYKKGYYNNALFLLKEVFELPSIKIIDAYRKVIYELMCFYDMEENKLGLDLANSTNIVHFSDEQSSKIFRMRGMFCEKIKEVEENMNGDRTVEEIKNGDSKEVGENKNGDRTVEEIKNGDRTVGDANTMNSVINLKGILKQVEETKKLYFQAIQFFSSPENHFYYTNLLLKHFQPGDVQDEVVSSCLQGLATSDSPYSKHLVMSLLLLLENHKLTYDLPLFKSLVKSVNVAYFVFFIPRMKKIQGNAEYLNLIFEGLMKKYPEAMIMSNVSDNKVRKDNKDKVRKDDKVSKASRKNNIKINIKNTITTTHKTTSHNSNDNFNYLKNLLGVLKDVFKLDEPAHPKVEIIELLNDFINHIGDSITNINSEFFLDKLIKLSDSTSIDLISLDFTSFTSLNDVLGCLIAIRKGLKNSLKMAGPLVNNEKLDTVNKILTERRLPLFGSYSKIQKDYSNVVYVESFDSYRVTRNERNKKEVYLIGNNGKYYKYEINCNSSSSTNIILNLPFLYHVLSLEINNSYHLRSRDAYLHLVPTQQISSCLHVDIFDVNFMPFEEITEKHPKNHVVEYVKEYLKVCKLESQNENICISLEKNILQLLKPEDKNKNKTKRIKLSEVFREIKMINMKDLSSGSNNNNNNNDSDKDWSLPKINSKTRLKIYSRVLPSVSGALSSFFRSTSDSSFSYFMQKYSFSRSFALNLSLNNFLKMKTKDPRNDSIEMYTGLFLRRNLVKISTNSENSIPSNSIPSNSISNNSISNNSISNNSIYISPGIQEWIGVENLEGPFLSCLFFSSDFFLKNESFDLIMRYFNFDALYARQILKKVVSVKGNDHEIVKIVSGWTDVNAISKNKVSENVWV